MVFNSRGRDLNAQNVEVDRWNRMDHILRMISYAQTSIWYADSNQDLAGMYQGLQMLLDTISPDLEENGKNQDGKPVKIKGMMTVKFSGYRTLLDNGMRLANQSRSNGYDINIRNQLRTGAYRKFQTLKYQLQQECERLGYNARKNDTTDAYRTGNN